MAGAITQYLILGIINDLFKLFVGYILVSQVINVTICKLSCYRSHVHI